MVVDGRRSETYDESRFPVGEGELERLFWIVRFGRLDGFCGRWSDLGGLDGKRCLWACSLSFH